MKDINDLTEEELVQIAIQENNAILEQQKEEAKQKEENEKGSKYIQNIYNKLTPEEEMQQLLFIFEGIENPNLSTDLSDKGVSYFLDSSVDRVGYKARCNEILGDAYKASNDKEKAHNYYRQAACYHHILNMKAEKEKCRMKLLNVIN